MRKKTDNKYVAFLYSKDSYHKDWGLIGLYHNNIKARLERKMVRRCKTQKAMSAMGCIRAEYTWIIKKMVIPENISNKHKAKMSYKNVSKKTKFTRKSHIVFEYKKATKATK